MAKKDNKITMPQTGAGLVRYFDEESLGPKLSPEHVLVATVILAMGAGKTAAAGIDEYIKSK